MFGAIEYLKDITNVDLKKKIYFRNIQTKYIPGYLIDSSTYIDWWPNDEFEERKTVLNVHHRKIIHWENYKGWQHTAQLLWDNRDDKVKSIFILVLASLWDKKHSGIPTWTTQIKQMTGSIIRAIFKQYSEITPWHHAVRRPLPYSIMENYYSYRMFKPNDIRELFALIGLELCVFLDNWSLVYLVENGGEINKLS